MHDPKIDEETATQPVDWRFKDEFDRLHRDIADLKRTLLEEADTYRVVLHTLSNSMNSMNLKMEVILQHIRRRGE